ncbi:uncharacterized protein LOC121786822 [Salvia splendens]|uniref:uncharacterized protein LOC121786822 n=1 Tax=Salvia splendens TaxID=180675 RepID=UPI001C26D9EE|nr:uncharacterized protein LOC121786822 [Salvia splendens]
MSVAPPILDGSNYQIWQIRMQAFLEGADLWEAVEVDYEVPPLGDNPTVTQIKANKERVIRKAKARSSLYAAVTPIIFNRIMHLDSAMSIWEFLKKKYEGNKRIKAMKAMNLKRELERVQMKDGESIQEFADKLLETANKLDVLATIASLENTKEISEILFAEVVSALQAQEQRKMLRTGEATIEGVMRAKVKHGSNWKKKADTKMSNTDAAGSQSGKGGNEACKHCGKTGHPFFKCWRRPDVKCRKCGKMGHIERICKGNNSPQGEARAAAGEVEKLFVASCHATRTTSE